MCPAGGPCFTASDFDEKGRRNNSHNIVHYVFWVSYHLSLHPVRFHIQCVSLVVALLMLTACRHGLQITCSRVLFPFLSGESSGDAPRLCRPVTRWRRVVFHGH